MSDTLTNTIIVHDLGEDADAWIVEGTTNKSEAREHVKSWIQECLGDEDASEYFENVDESRAIVKNNWYWKPLDDAEPTGDQILTSLDDNPEHEINEVFAGVHLSS